MIADLVAYDPNGQIAALVEVKGRTGRPRDWATQVRRYMLARGAIPNSRYLLLVLPDKLYLWKDADNARELVEPTYEIDAGPLFQPYFESAGVSPPRLSPEAFELVVTAWLNSLVHSGIPENMPDQQRRVLEQSGLLEAIRGGSVAVEVPL
jgi:hypothetical protein